jgi:3-deoxy-D-manno-octulosonic-acid transferase
LHAVSVGEVLACVEFLRRLREEFPHSRLFVSASTLAGRATAVEKLHGLADGVFYAPVDYVFAVRRVLRTLKPSVVVIAETEIWPNLFREATRIGAAVAIVNGRISDRAYPRYLRWRWFFRAVLPAADVILAQTEDIRARFVALGAEPARTYASGNFKYDFLAHAAGAESPVMRLLDRIQPDTVWIAASTMPPAEPGDVDEDDAVIAAFRDLSQRRLKLLLLLAPRKPERFDGAARKLESAGIRFVRRSALAAELPSVLLPCVLLLDTIGELSGLFAVAEVVFMGGTLARRGGHNILEPALFGKPVVAGPHMENFQAIAGEFRAARAMVEIATAGDLPAAVERLIADPGEAQAIGRRALSCAEARRGATQRAVEQVRRLYNRGVPSYRPSMPWYAFGWVLALLWRRGARRRQERGLRQQRKLSVPVISVGNLTMGGTGKTPAVLLLAAALKERGHNPGILSRGYGRTSPHRQLIVAPGASISAQRTGDEPALFVRSRLAPVGIGPDRFHTGTALLHEFGSDLVLLDDGFQHLKLARDVDLVLIDALRPFGGGALFPLGRLREPLSGLARADLIVITRCECSDLAPAIETVVRRWNSRAPVFRASVQPQAWVENRTGRQYAPEQRPFGRAGVFCALGNPDSFRGTLRRLGVQPVDWVEFEDHHRYRPGQLRRIAHQMHARGAEALVTTEKDAANLCDSCDDLLAPLPLFWLKIALVVDGESEFIGEVERRLRALPGGPRLEVHDARE